MFELEKLEPITVKLRKDQLEYLRSYKGYNLLLRHIIDNYSGFKKYKKRKKNKRKECND